MRTKSLSKQRNARAITSRTKAIHRATLEALEDRRLLSTVAITATDASATELLKTTGKFHVTRSDSTGSLVVHLDIDGDATNTTDYTTVASTLTMAAGVASADITITPVDDTAYEGAEDVVIAIAADDAYDVDADDDSATVTITDNEKPTINLTVDDAMADEDDDTQTGTFIIERDGPTAGDLAVKITITGTATNGTDYETLSTTQTIEDGESTLEFNVTATDDSTLEGSEKVIVTLAAGTTYLISSTEKTGTVTIFDDEVPTVKVVASDASALEGSATDTGKFTISRNGPTTDLVTVNYTMSGTATNGTDYTEVEGSVDIPAGKASADVLIKGLQDTTVELGETVKLTIDADSAYEVDEDADVATVTMKDDDKPTVTLTAIDTAASETGSANTGKFKIARTGATTEALVVNIVATGTAKTGVDYVALSKTVTIPAGKASRNFEVAPIDDLDLEGNETVIATLGAGTTYLIGTDKTATVTIAEDEVPDVTIKATDATATEPTTDKGLFTITRTGLTGAALTVDLEIDGTATNGTDYTTIADSVEIPAGKAFVTVAVAPTDDTDLEGSETVIVGIADSSSYDHSGGNDSATVKLVDNEKPTLTITAMDSSATEEGATTGTFKVTRTGPTDEELKVVVTVTGTATKVTDYNSFDTTITIAAGASNKTMTVKPVDDSTLEVDETVIATLAVNAAYTIGTDKTATVTIAENDLPTVTMKATDAVATEPTTDKGLITFTRNGPTVEALDISFEVDGTATPGDDYTSLSGTTVTIPAGKLFATLAIAPIDDTTLENTETIDITLVESEAGDYLVDEETAEATVSLKDNEKPTVSLTATDDTAEEDGEDDTIVLKFARDGATAEPLDVFYTVTGTATAGTDTSDVLSGKITIPAASLNKTLTITPENDDLVEGAETLILTTKVSATTYTIGTDKTVTATINDDELPTVGVVTTDGTGKEGTKDGLVFTFSRTGATRAALVLDVDVEGNTSGADLTSVPTTVTIPVGKSSVTLTAVAKNDLLYEGTESFGVSLAPNDDYDIDEDAATAEGFFSDDELPTVKLTVADATATETSNTTGNFTIARASGEPTTDPITVNVLITGTAKNGKDYNLRTTQVTIDAGSSSALFTVTPKTDSAVEGPETVILTLDKGSYKIDAAATTGTITIADAQKPTIGVLLIDSPIDEDDSLFARFRIYRTGITVGQTLDVGFAIGGTAAGSRYTLTDVDGEDITDTITIAAGQAYADVYVTPVDNSSADGDETVTLTLGTDSAYSIASSDDDATITINDDD